MFYSQQRWKQRSTQAPQNDSKCWDTHHQSVVYSLYFVRGRSQSQIVAVMAQLTLMFVGPWKFSSHSAHHPQHPGLGLPLRQQGIHLNIRKFQPQQTTRLSAQGKLACKLKFSLKHMWKSHVFFQEKGSSNGGFSVWDPTGLQILS